MTKQLRVFILLFYVIVTTCYAETQDCDKNLFVVYPTYMGQTKQYINEKVDNTLSLEKLILHSELIIIGKIISDNFPQVQMGKSNEKSYEFSECSIEVSKVLKGDTKSNKVILAMPAFITMGSEWYKWDGPIFRTGTKGIWFLTKQPDKTPNYLIQIAGQKGDYYFADRIERYKEFDQKLIEEITRLIK